MYISHHSGRRYNRPIRLYLQSDFFVLPIKKNKAEKISFHIDDKEDLFQKVLINIVTNITKEEMLIPRKQLPINQTTG